MNLCTFATCYANNRAYSSPDSYRGVRSSDPLFSFLHYFFRQSLIGMPVVYILYSKKVNRFYIGFTSLDVNDRLSMHNEKYYAGKYTSISNDWELYVELVCQSINQSRKVEKHIKRMKSRKYIQDLKSYPEMREKLLLRYKEDN